MQIDCEVKYSISAYVTNTVKGQRASSTMDERTAVERLGVKLLGPSFASVEVVATHGLLSSWRIHSDTEGIAWAWQSGLIEVGAVGAVPKGAIAFARGPEKALRAALDVAARHGMGESEGKLLVPGVPEAEGPDAKVEALIKWVEWRSQMNGMVHAHGVRFSRDEEALVA